MIRWHPDSAVLIEFSAGSLSPALALAVRTHSKSCRQCREQLEDLLLCAASLWCQSEVDSQAPSESMSEALLARTLSRLDEPQAPPAATPSLDTLLPSDYQQVPWRSILPGVAEWVVPLGDHDYRVALHRIQPGAHVLAHGHQGVEVTQVLQGGFSDQLGTYLAGDFIWRDGSHRHRPQATWDQVCICLTVQQAPIQVSGWRGYLLNPLLQRWGFR